VALWVTCIYFPIAHMVWYWGGPDAWASAAKAPITSKSFIVP
jgi:Amt family ammonium transporter